MTSALRPFPCPEWPAATACLHLHGTMVCSPRRKAPAFYTPTCSLIAEHALRRQLYALRHCWGTNMIVCTGSTATALEARLLRSWTHVLMDAWICKTLLAARPPSLSPSTGLPTLGRSAGRTLLRTEAASGAECADAGGCHWRLQVVGLRMTGWRARKRPCFQSALADENGTKTPHARV